MSCVDGNNSLLFVNYTQQKVTIRLIKVKRDINGNSVLTEDGHYQADAVSEPQTFTQSFNGEDPKIFSGWGPINGYDGFTAQTADGLNSVTAALYDGPYPFDDTGAPCYTAWIYLCFSSNGATNCVNSSGTTIAPQSSYIVLSPTGYYITEPGSGKQSDGVNPDAPPSGLSPILSFIILILFVFVVVASILVFVRMHKRGVI